MFDNIGQDDAARKAGDSLQISALLGFAAAGLGLASLPRAVAHDSVRQGALREIKLTVGAPEFDYIALIRIDGISAFHRAVVQLMRECSDFNTPFQSSRTSTNES